MLKPRLESVETLEIVLSVFVSVASFALFTDWRIPILLMLPVLHIVNAAMAERPSYWLCLLSLFDVTAIVYQYGIIFGAFDVQLYKFDPYVGEESNTKNYLKLGLLIGFFVCTLLHSFNWCVRNLNGKNGGRKRASHEEDGDDIIVETVQSARPTPQFFVVQQPHPPRYTRLPNGRSLPP